MFYIITFYSDELEDQGSEFLIDSDACEGHIRIGDVNIDTPSLICELYNVFDEPTFLDTIKWFKTHIPHMEAYRKTSLFP
jgi:hypothetical protein